MAQVYVMEESPSTNLEAQDKVKYGHGDAIIAIRQTAGRGQRGNRWESAPGENLTFSLVVEPTFLPASWQFMLSEVSALAVAETLSIYGVDAMIKWTNDIYVGNGKICGMLLEHDLGGKYLARSIVGIGINVNQLLFPPEVPNPSSMALLTGQVFDTRGVFDSFNEIFHRRYSELEAGVAEKQGIQPCGVDIPGNPGTMIPSAAGVMGVTGGGLLESISGEYNSLLFRRGEPHRFNVPGEGAVIGVIRSVEADGRLMVEIDGQVRGFLFKEIEFII